MAGVVLSCRPEPRSVLLPPTGRHVRPRSALLNVVATRLETVDKNLPAFIGVRGPTDVVSDRLPHRPKPALGFPLCLAVAFEKVDQYAYGIIRGRRAGQPHALRRGADPGRRLVSR